MAIMRFKRVALYIRVSTEYETQKKSLENQKAVLVKYASEKGWTVVKIYMDVKTGTSNKRNGLRNLIADAKGGVFDVIIAKELSRFGRNTDDLSDLKRLLDTHDIDMVTVVDNAINTIEGDRSKFALYAWLYENESRTTSQRIKATLRQKALRGEFVNGDPPYGYDLVNKKLVPKEDETVEVVKVIYKLYLEGRGGEHIARYLTKMGYATPSMVKGRKNAGFVWHDSTVMQILSNPHYAGHLSLCRETTKDITVKKRVLNKEPVLMKNYHQAIISPEDFDAVQNLMTSRRVTGRKTGSKRTFSDVLICEDCGKKLWYYDNRKGYVCKSHVVKEQVLVESIQGDLRDYAKAYEDDEAIIEQFKKKQVATTKKANTQIKNHEKQIEKLKRAKSNLTVKYGMDEILLEDYRSAVEGINVDLVKLESQLIDSRANAPEDEVQEQTLLMKKQLMKFASFDKITREVINRFVDKIIVSENGDFEIFYRFSIC